MRNKLIGRLKDNPLCILGFRYDPKKQELLIGGAGIWKEQAKELGLAFGKKERSANACMFRNGHRCRWKWTKIKPQDWEVGISRLEPTWMFEATKCFRRLMG